MTTATLRKGQSKDGPVSVAAVEPAIVQNALRFELKPKTEAGALLVRIAEEKSVEFAPRAAEHDRDGSYAFEAIDSLKAAGYFTAPVPKDLGGFGVESAYDLVVASSRLARGDASLTIGVNMHLAAVHNVARRYRIALASGNERRIAAFRTALGFIKQAEVIMAAAVSEAGQDLRRPATTAVRTEDGWVINGRKIFCTMSPAANAFYVAVTYLGEDGEEYYAYAQLPKGTPGVTVHDDWDALGMRASGSHSVSFENVKVPASAIRGGYPAGRLTVEFMERNLTAGLFHASSSLGIAEAAHDLVVQALAKKRGDGTEVAPHTLISASQNAIDLATARAIFGRGGDLIDQYYADHPADDGGFDEVAALFAEVQSAKTHVNEAAQRIVDRALTLSGGAGYFNKHPLSRAYRDVRAGAFMHPLGANRAYEFIGQVALGLEPVGN